MTGEPIIYISLGTTFNHAPAFYSACFEAFSGQPWQVVLSIGAWDVQDTPPPNFIVRKYVPQLELLKRTTLFVTHGGMNSANEGLHYGVPMLVVPQRGDQHIVGARVAELGGGIDHCAFRNSSRIAPNGSGKDIGRSRVPVSCGNVGAIASYCRRCKACGRGDSAVCEPRTLPRMIVKKHISARIA